MVMGYGLESWGLVLGSGKIFLFSILSRLALGPTQPLIQWTLREISPGVKQSSHEADHSPAPNAEIKSGGAIPPLYIFMLPFSLY
jgi:hypothetical protein